MPTRDCKENAQMSNLSDRRITERTQVQYWLFLIFILYWLSNFQTGIVGRELATNVYTYTHLEPILYALGVGMSTKDPDHLKFLFEGNEEFCCLLSFGVIPAQTSMFDGVPSLPGLNIDLAKVWKSSIANFVCVSCNWKVTSISIFVILLSSFCSRKENIQRTHLLLLYNVSSYDEMYDEFDIQF